MLPAIKDLVYGGENKQPIYDIRAMQDIMEDSVAAALILGSFLSSFLNLLYKVSPWDPLTLIIISLGLIYVTILASYLPARRAAGINPMIALRHE